MSIGSKVRKYREAKGLSQEDLAFRLDVAQTTISSIESDKSVPNSILLNKIAQELDVNINDILDEGNTQINNIERNEGVISFDTNTVNMLSEKLIEQYEERIKELKEQVEFWKHKAGESK
ncbi:helix-turn-helix domain-containing protein [Chryseobacterium oryctis]|uniref:Helix-turn-helix transcriptional regulator n=1 Tax=Chryseobacterium oryctis TaxID=2952618 RepID=A0ABT3HMB1_9FLAO|nr:helix-turn-helix transcriptional regulator [Chryseobacterium oryctis]MCW3160917.1 helix-turn-helix transcriptional regulator [Chryseobacterium oryctis]